MLAQRLLRGHAGHAYHLSGVFAMTTSPDGTWPSATDAFYVGGRSIIGFGDNISNYRIGQFTHATRAVSLVTVGGAVPADQHERPAIIRRSSDGRYVTVFGQHNSAPSAVYRRVSTNPDDISAWGTATDIKSGLGPATAVSYPALFELTDGLYLFYRDNDGTSNWCLAKSTDGGATWSRLATIVFATRAYGRCVRSSSTRLDFAFTDGSYAEDYASVYHCSYDGTWRTSDGTAIGGSPPFAFADLTKVYDGASAGARFPNSIAKLGTDIVVTFPVQTGPPTSHIGTDEDYEYARWNGSSWTVTAAETAIGGYTPDFTEGGIVVDPKDLDHVILSKRTSGTFRIWDYVTADGGSTWTKTQISSSGDPDMYPWFIEDHALGLDYVWLTGTFTSETVFDCAIMAFG